MHTSPFAVAAFYKFVPLDDLPALRERWHRVALQLDIKGTVLLAAEGVNGTVAGSDAAIAAFLQALRGDPRLADLEPKHSYAHNPPFARLKVRIKREIVTLGQPGIDPNRRVGEYVEPQDWNRLIFDPDVMLLDTRNHYEFAIGSFSGAIDPGIASFRDFPGFVARMPEAERHRPVATFCTGGIRCEKATAFLLNQGFSRVYHLKGGILKYLEVIPREESLWRGECFVFDERVAVGHGVRPGTVCSCRRCGRPIDRGQPCPRCSAKPPTTSPSSA